MASITPARRPMSAAAARDIQPEAGAMLRLLASPAVRLELAQAARAAAIQEPATLMVVAAARVASAASADPAAHPAAAAADARQAEGHPLC